MPATLGKNMALNPACVIEHVRETFDICGRGTFAVTLVRRFTIVVLETIIGGWEKHGTCPTRNPSPAPTHPHRTHDTTDQWRETVQWLGRFWKNVRRCGWPPRPTSRVFKHVFVDLSKEKQWFWKAHRKAHSILVENTSNLKHF